MKRLDDEIVLERPNQMLDAWSEALADMSKNINRGNVSQKVVSSDVASLFGVDTAKDDDRSGWTIQFDFPDFDKIKKELAEKYKLTPAEEAQNKAVDLGKKWGTNPNGKKVTPYIKALAAKEEHARLLFDEKNDENEPYNHFGVSLLNADFNTISISDFIKKCSTAKEFKDYLKEHDVKIEDLNEKDIGAILDAWPDFFEGEELSNIKEGDKETRIPYMPKLFTEFAMESASDKVCYIKPVYTNNSTKDDFTIEMCDDPTRMKSLFDSVEESEPEKPEKLSWKKQQRMRKNNPMWKPN